MNITPYRSRILRLMHLQTSWINYINYWDCDFEPCFQKDNSLLLCYLYWVYIYIYIYIHAHTYIYISIIKRATSPSHQTLCYLSQALKVKHNSLIVNLTMHSSNPYLNAFCLKDFRTVNSSSSSLWTLLLPSLFFDF